MATTKYRPTIGDRRFQVEWCTEIPVNEFGDGDLDAARYRRRLLETLEAARAFAKEVLPNDAFGSIPILPVEFVPYDERHAGAHPHVGFWEAIAEPEFVDHESIEN